MTALQATHFGDSQTGRLFPGTIDEEYAAATVQNEESIGGPLEKRLPAKIHRTIGGLGRWTGRRISSIHMHDGIK